MSGKAYYRTKMDGKHNFKKKEKPKIQIKFRNERKTA